MLMKRMLGEQISLRNKQLGYVIRIVLVQIVGEIYKSSQFLLRNNRYYFPHIRSLTVVTPTSLNARAIFSTASSICSKVWVAINEKRNNDESDGTAGDTTGLTNTPAFCRSLVTIKVLSLSRT